MTGGQSSNMSIKKTFSLHFIASSKTLLSVFLLIDLRTKVEGV